MPAKIIVLTEDQWADVGVAVRGVIVRHAECVLTGERKVWRVDKAANANHPDHLTPGQLAEFVGRLDPGD